MGLRAFLALFLLLGVPVLAQDEEAEEEEGCTVIEVGGDGDEGAFDIEVDPFPDAEGEDEEPNRPPPIKVGEWEPPELDEAALRELQALVARRMESPGDPALRYRLAEFYLARGWFPQAEAEFLRSAEMEPDSIRPWEGLIHVYRAEPATPEEGGIQLGNRAIWFPRQQEREEGWLPSERDRNDRITRAYRELLRRRPDDIVKRKELIDHLKAVGDHKGVREHAPVVLERLPGDAQTRFDLAEALRRDPARVDEAIRLLEENLERAPGHAASALRLARLIAVRDGTKAADRIGELENRAFFHLFVRSDLAPVAYREDILRMARDLAGPALANQLWDETMKPARKERIEPWGFDAPERRFYTRWLVLHFPHALPRDRLRVISSLARRGDEGAAATLVSFLWHLEDYTAFGIERIVDREIGQKVEREALAAASGLGAVTYPSAERFLRSAASPAHRRRAVELVRRLGDARAVAPLLDALAWDNGEQASYGVAAALEELGDARALDGLVEAALDVRRPSARRSEAAEALAVFKDPRALEALNGLLEEEEFRLIASYGLFRLTGADEAFQRMKTILKAGERDAEVLRLAAKCEDPRVEELLLEGLVAVRDPDVRAQVVEELRARFWKSAGPKVKELFLEEAQSPAVSDLAVVELGRMGGEDAADRLLNLVEGLKDGRWELAARALAETGDPRAVRYFNRMRILEKDALRRALATELHADALKRQAQLERARSDG